MKSAEQGLPRYASVVVVGGGAMGCSTLYHLAKHGVTDAVLLERNQLTSGTTWHSAAQVRALRSSRNMTDLIRYSIELYSRLEHETGQHTGWINKGSLSIATTPDRLVHIRRQQALARLFGVRAESVSAGEAKERWPLMNADDVIGAVWSPDDGRVGPSDLCAALVKGARSAGALIFENTGVIGIDTAGDKITGVETTAGRIRCDAIALCTGLWSRQAAAMAGATVPVWPCEHFYLLTQPVPGIQGNLPTLSDHDSHLYVRDDSGGLLVGCFEPVAKSIDPALIGEEFAFQLLPEDWDHFEPMMHNALHRLPILETASVKMLLNGPESFTPDGAFMLGETAQTSGLFLGCGMNSVGIATAGGAGMALAHCIVHGHTPTDLSEVDPNRFAECFNRVDMLTERVPEVLGKHYEIGYPNRQWESARQLRLLPLHEQWRALGAYFGQFDGWERPLYFDAQSPPANTFERPGWFEQVGREVKRTNQEVTVFDQSTLGKIDVRGPDACRLLQRVCTNNMDCRPGSVIYTVMLNERGGIEADMTAIRLSDDHYRLYTGSAAVRRDMAWLRRHALTDKVVMSDVTEQFAVVALMGPWTTQVINAIGATELNRVKYFRTGQGTIGGVDVLAARLSYVGESGFEITCAAEQAVSVYGALRAQNVQPAGLLAQTSMRIEKCFLANGHDMDTDLSPVQAGIDFAVDWSTDFVGRDALHEKQDRGEARQLVSIVLDDLHAVPLGDEPVYRGEGIIGKTTSAAFGFRVGRPVAIANIHAVEVGSDRADVAIDIAGTLYSGRVVPGAAFDPKGHRVR